jgi:hypothetical protein
MSLQFGERKYDTLSLYREEMLYLTDLESRAVNKELKKELKERVKIIKKQIEMLSREERENCKSCDGGEIKAGEIQCGACVKGRRLRYYCPCCNRMYGNVIRKDETDAKIHWGCQKIIEEYEALVKEMNREMYPKIKMSYYPMGANGLKGGSKWGENAEYLLEIVNEEGKKNIYFQHRTNYLPFGQHLEAAWMGEHKKAEDPERDIIYWNGYEYKREAVAYKDVKICEIKIEQRANPDTGYYRRIINEPSGRGGRRPLSKGENKLDTIPKDIREHIIGGMVENKYKYVDMNEENMEVIYRHGNLYG